MFNKSSIYWSLVVVFFILVACGGGTTNNSSSSSSGDSNNSSLNSRTESISVSSNNQSNSSDPNNNNSNNNDSNNSDSNNNISNSSDLNNNNSNDSNNNDSRNSDLNNNNDSDNGNDLSNAERDALLSTLKRSVYISGWGGGGDVEDFCVDETVSLLYNRIICLNGYSLSNLTEIELYGPDGAFLGATDIFNTSGAPYVNIVNSLNIPYGEWKVVVNKNDGYYDEFYINVLDISANHSSFGISKDNVLERPYNAFVYPLSRHDYKLGDSIFVVGWDFEPNEYYPIGIYINLGNLYYDINLNTGNVYHDINIFDLVSETVVKTNGLGQFSLKTDPDSMYREGYYSIGTNLVSSDTRNVNNEDIGEYADVPHVEFYVGDYDSIVDALDDAIEANRNSNLLTNFTCTGAPSTRLEVGVRANVTYTDGTPGSIRPAPASSQILGKVPEGTGMVIIDGPKCNNSRVWWKVETDNGYEGWIAEGKSGEYWLEPTD